MVIAVSLGRVDELLAAGQTDNPFAAWDNFGARATWGGTATLADGPAINAFDGTTYDYWRPNVTGTNANLRITLGSALNMSNVAIAAHNLASLGGTVTVQRSIDNGVTWSVADAGIGSVTPTDNSPIIFRMRRAGNAAVDWRLFFNNLAPGAALRVGVAFFGVDMVFPSRFYSGFAPPIAPNQVELTSNVSQGGNLLSSSVVMRGSKMAAQFQHLPPAFVRGEMLGFIQHFNEGKGFFFGWRPETYAQDAVYAWRDGAVLQPVNAGGRAFMQASIAARIYEG